MKCPHCDGTGEIDEYEEPDGICDGCAQTTDECLCDIDLDDVRNCDSVFHPGCDKCAIRE